MKIQATSFADFVKALDGKRVRLTAWLREFKGEIHAETLNNDWVVLENEGKLILVAKENVKAIEEI